MKIDEALNILTQVCAGYKGNLQEHQALQEALMTVGDKCKVPKAPEESKEDSKAKDSGAKE